MEKPRIRYFNGGEYALWLCESDECAGCGLSPLEAYDNWFNKQIPF